MSVRQLRLVVTASDYDAALAFYRDVLGLEELGAFTGDLSGATAAWSGVGTALPAVQVEQLEYDSSRALLVAGTLPEEAVVPSPAAELMFAQLVSDRRLGRDELERMRRLLADRLGEEDEEDAR